MDDLETDMDYPDIDMDDPYTHMDHMNTRSMMTQINTDDPDICTYG